MQLNTLNKESVSAPAPMANHKVHLGDYVDILRMGGNRFPLEEDACIPGKLPDGRFFCREVTYTCFGIKTGFIDVAHGRPVMMDGLSDNQYKHFLQANDILCAHVGMPDTIGSVGFVIKAAEDAVAARSLCILRPRNIDPVWLYYFLREPAAWERALSNSTLRKEEYNEKFSAMKQNSGLKRYGRPSSVQHLTSADIKEICFYPPSERDIKTINTLHKTILDQTIQIQGICEDMDQELRRVHSVIMLGAHTFSQAINSPERSRRRQRS